MLMPQTAQHKSSEKSYCLGQETSKNDGGPFSKDVNTHHHYGAQQVRTLKVDSIFLRIIPSSSGESLSLRFERFPLPIDKFRSMLNSLLFNKDSSDFSLFSIRPCWPWRNQSALPVGQTSQTGNGCTQSCDCRKMA